MSADRTKTRAPIERQDEELPSPSELYTPAQLLHLYPHLLTENRLRHALRNRKRNGLMGRRDERRRVVERVVFQSPLGAGLLIHGPGFVRWMCGLSGLRKPRGLRSAQLGDPTPPDRLAHDTSQPSTP